MGKAHNTPYAMHLGSTKMYQDLKPFYQWPTMRKDVEKLPTGKSRTSSSCGEIVTFKDTRMEMGEDNDGFCDWVAAYISET